jgi:hypothetical protein
MAKRAVVRSVFGPAVKTFLMRALVRPAGVVVELPMPRVIPGMAIIIVVRESWGRQSEQHCGTNQKRSDPHTAPLGHAPGRQRTTESELRPVRMTARST